MHKLNKIKLKSDLWPGNGSGLFCSSHDLHNAETVQHCDIVPTDNHQLLYVDCHI